MSFQRVSARLVEVSLEALYFALNRRSDSFACFLIAVLLAWPEKPSQPVSALARHNMNVQMRNGLADLIVHRYECAFRIHGGFHSSG